MAQPNIVVFLTDDQGYGDLSCMGATDFRTPNLDRLAQDGVRFTDWYSNSPVCSPARAALLTGRYPGNAGVRSILAARRTASGLPPEVPTLASALRRLGYVTAMSGKWHLGLKDGCRPHDHGFDRWFGFMAGCVDYYSHIFYWEQRAMNPLHDLWEDGHEIHRDGEYLTEVITAKAIEYIRWARGQNKPFFLYVPYNAPHYPMHAPQKYRDRFAHLSWERRIMAAMLGAVDDGVGQVRDELERQGLTANTCVFFMSDNGPSREARNWLDGSADLYYGGSAGLLRGHKFSLFEGGIRVPGLLSWPARIPAGQVVSEPAAAIDIFPTFLRLAAQAHGDSADPCADYELDGKDIMPMVTEGAASPHDGIFWEMGDQTAVRRGRWKLVLDGRLDEGGPEVAPVHLADLEADPGERRNLKDREPGICAELEALARHWRAGIEERWQDQWHGGV